MKPSDVAGKLSQGACSADVSTPFGLTGSLILLVAPQRDAPGQSGRVRFRAKATGRAGSREPSFARVRGRKRPASFSVADQGAASAGATKFLFNIAALDVRIPARLIRCSREYRTL